MSIEAMKQALRTLDAFTPHGRVTWILTEEVDVDAAVVALRKAIEQWGKQTPTKIFGPNLEEILNGAGFYRRREWVGLTDEEVCEVAEIDGADAWLFEVARAIEAKLKEKNQ